MFSSPLSYYVVTIQSYEGGGGTPLHNEESTTLPYISQWQGMLPIDHPVQEFYCWCGQCLQMPASDVTTLECCQLVPIQPHTPHNTPSYHHQPQQ